MRGLGKVAALALAPLLLAACEPAATTGGSAAAVPLGDYQLVSMGGQDVESAHVTLLLEADRISGAGFCNRYSGAQAGTLPELAIGPVVSTRMACIGDRMPQETGYFAAIEGATAARFEGGRLTLTGSGPELVYTPHTPEG
ncbi:META domain-containing protein [Paracoccus zhejiangensis]|uniref:META domain-containing protein n=1 Tax=Paracoccus zhejiangensis TaxID=1077935 RepID=A0A2H5F216_9RHOB|nr:META domain-containing protein [Paracoccus zhejiangensis]AUH65595.1 META domain-containing protein [Paracoccus zhejiangensis]